MNTKHVSDETLTRLVRGTLPDAERFAALGHIAACDSCRDAFTDCADALPIAPPKGLSEVILAKTAPKCTLPTNASPYPRMLTCAVGIAAALMLWMSGGVTAINQFTATMVDKPPVITVVSEARRDADRKRVARDIERQKQASRPQNYFEQAKKQLQKNPFQPNK